MDDDPRAYIYKHGGVFMIYMDNAATSYPKPEQVIEAVAECMAGWCANPGRAGHEYAMRSSEEIYGTRKKAAARVGAGAEAENIRFTKNCTEALNMAIKGILKKGDHVITTMMEHNSVLRPLFSAKKYGIETSLLRCSSEGYPESGSLEKALKKNTKMIICTLSSNVTGTIMPVEELGAFADKHGIIFIIDAAQGLGSIPFDAKKCKAHAVAASGHKSLMGPQGTGFLYIDSTIRLQHIIEGGTGTESLELKQPDKAPEGYEAGTLNVPGITGLNAGLSYILSEGIEKMRRKEKDLMECLHEELKDAEGIIMYGPRDPAEKTAVLSLNIEGIDCEKTAALLNDEYGIGVRAGYHCAPLAHNAIGTENTGCVRLSPGLFSTYEDVMATAEALRRIASEKC